MNQICFQLYNSMSKGLRSFLSEKLEEGKELSKTTVKSQSTRDQYRRLYEWSKKQLANFEQVLQRNEQTEISAKVLEDQKKVVVSMLLETSRIAKQQCVEKGQIFEELIQYAIQFMNQHQKYYDMLSYTQIKHFRDSISELEKEYYQKNQQLRDNISVLTSDKEHRWRNIFMVVKDNRVLRRQKAKLMKKHKEEVWRTKQLEEDLINVRSQNEKYKIMCQEYKLKQNQLKNYVTNQLLLLHLDEKVRQYPGRARRLLKKQLLNCQINQLNTLEEKIKFIIQAMEQNNEVCEQFDDWDQNTNSTRLFYNVSVQTYIQMESVGVNTVAPVVQKKIYQSIKSQTRYRDFIHLEQISKNIDLKIIPSKKAQPERKKTQELSLSLSRFKRKGSITSSLNEQANQNYPSRFNQSSGFKDKLKVVSNTVCLKLTGIRTGKMTNFTSTVLNVQPEPEEIETKKPDQNYNNQISLQRKKQKSAKIKKFSKKEPERILEKGQPAGKEEIFQKYWVKHNMKMCYHILQVFYKPKVNTQLEDQNSCENSESGVHLEESRFESELKLKQKKKSISDNNTNLLGSAKLVKAIESKYLINKNMLNETVSEDVTRHKNFPILEVQEVTSNHTLQSETQKFDDLQLESEDTQELPKKQQVMGSYSNRLKATDRPKLPFSELKNKLWILQKRHKRQNTQNLEIGKSKDKIKNLIKQQSGQNDIKVRPEESTNKLRIRNSKVLKIQEQERKKSTVNLSDIYDHKKVTKIEIIQEKRTMKNEKLLEKLTNAIFLKRKEVMTNPQSMRVFAHQFLLSIFENNKTNYYVNKIRPQGVFYSSLKNIDQKEVEMHYACLLIEYLLPTQRYELFAEDMMVFFVIMLDKLNSMGVLSGFSSLFTVPYQYGTKTLEYLCSIYLSPSQSLDFMLSKIRSKDEPKILNMVQCFLKLYLYLDKIIFESELWQFLSIISRWTVDGLTDTELADIFSIIRLMDVESEYHFKELKHYTSKNFPLHRFCLYAHRFEWKNVYRIKTWIQEKYLDYFGLYSFTACEAENFCSQLQSQMTKNKKYSFLVRILKQMCFKHKQLGVELDQNFIKLCRMTMTLDEMENEKIYSPNLLDIQQVYRKYLRESLISEQ